MNKTQVARAIAAWVAETGDREAIFATTRLINYLRHQGFTDGEIVPEAKRVASEYFEQLDDENFRLSARGMEALAELDHPAAVSNYEARIHLVNGIGVMIKFFLTASGLRQWLESYTPEENTILTLFRNGSEISPRDL